jgi:hypothetical protein
VNSISHAIKVCLRVHYVVNDIVAKTVSGGDPFVVAEKIAAQPNCCAKVDQGELRLVLAATNPTKIIAIW